MLKRVSEFSVTNRQLTAVAIEKQVLVTKFVACPYAKYIAMIQHASQPPTEQ